MKRVCEMLGILVAGCLSACVNPAEPVSSPAPWYSDTNERGDPLLGVFEGRVPCNEPTMRGCSAIKVALVLYHHPRTSVPTTYRLGRVYVAESPEGSRIVVDGTWHVAEGIALDPRARVYRLDVNAPQEFAAFWPIGDDILFVLDGNLKPRVGTAGWSYVLNRTRQGTVK